MARERDRGDRPASSRREFGRRLALGAAAALAAPALTCRGGGEGAPAGDHPAPMPGRAAIDPRLVRIFARHGRALSAAQRKELARLLKVSDENGAALAKFALQVADEPVLVLRPRPVRRDAR